jgi:hypothetical protein
MIDKTNFFNRPILPFRRYTTIGGPLQAKPDEALKEMIEEPNFFVNALPPFLVKKVCFYKHFAKSGSRRERIQPRITPALRAASTRTKPSGRGGTVAAEDKDAALSANDAD